MSVLNKYLKYCECNSLNDLEDISLDEPCAAMYGYTLEDVEITFGHLLQGVNMENSGPGTMATISAETTSARPMSAASCTQIQEVFARIY